MRFFYLILLVVLIFPLNESVGASFKTTIPYAFYLFEHAPKQPLSHTEKEFLTKVLFIGEVLEKFSDSLAKTSSIPFLKRISFFYSNWKFVESLVEKKYPILRKQLSSDVITDTRWKKLYSNVKVCLEKRCSYVKSLSLLANLLEYNLFTLEKARESTDNNDLKVLYSFLLSVTQRHLKGVVSLLSRYGVDYTPVFLQKEAFIEKLKGNSVGLPYLNAVSPVSVSDYGLVVGVYKERGIRRKELVWWVIDVKTQNGKVLKMRLAPVWFLPEIKVSVGDKVFVKAFKPPFWELIGISDYMVCALTDSSKSISYDFSRWRCWCRRIFGAAEETGKN